MKILFKVPIDNHVHHYCCYCGSSHINVDTHTCFDCGKTGLRHIIFDPKVKWWLDKEKNYWHESIGIFVVFEHKILSFERNFYPRLIGFPAGHVDNDEVSAEKAAKRELFEETGIKTNKLNHMITIDIPGDECRRGSDHHKFHFYKLIVNMKPDIKLNDEGKQLIWLTTEELLKKDIVYPLRYFLKNYTHLL